MSRIAFLVACVLLSACTTIKINHDDTTSITHSGDAEAGRQLAERACLKAGRSKAEVVATVNKNPNLPAGSGRQVTTFRCISG